MVFVGVKYHVYLLTFSKTGGEEAGRGRGGQKHTIKNTKGSLLMLFAFQFFLSMDTRVSCVYVLVVTMSLTTNEALKWLSLQFTINAGVILVVTV